MSSAGLSIPLIDCSFVRLFNASLIHVSDTYIMVGSGKLKHKFSHDFAISDLSALCAELLDFLPFLVI